jgi:hypothetical protein
MLLSSLAGGQKLLACYEALQRRTSIVRTCVRLVSRDSPLPPAAKAALVTKALAAAAATTAQPVACALDGALTPVALAVLNADGVDVTADTLHGAVPVPVASPLTLVVVRAQIHASNGLGSPPCRWPALGAAADAGARVAGAAGL